MDAGGCVLFCRASYGWLLQTFSQPGGWLLYASLGRAIRTAGNTFCFCRQATGSGGTMHDLEVYLDNNIIFLLELSKALSVIAKKTKLKSQIEAKYNVEY